MSTHSQTNCHRVEHADDFFVQHGYTRVPQLVQWMATLRCGLKCEHCLAGGDKAGLADMPLDKVKALIDEIADLGVREFLVTGGEPLVREDLAEVIDYLGHKQVNWTLNTAACPGQELRAAITKYRPGFVAASLDGPKVVHDGFRGKAGAYQEALESIAFFKSLGVRVCAGTTVTTRNYHHLDETFHLAVGSGANQWGIHLLVPEGRAAVRKDLFLSRSQLKRLIKFVARKRRYFDVGMADEIGYLGLLEPLVRDVPLTCGAGRSQCVVLPDGSVVPCTTLDRSTSAGNLYDRDLETIWSEGFGALRSWQPQGKCRQCDYAKACKGGCWLQRKAGTECFKEVWHIPGVLKTAAGIAICLGGGVVNEQECAAQPGSSLAPVQAKVVVSNIPSDPLFLDGTIMQFYLDQARGVRGDYPYWQDWGSDFFRDIVQDAVPEDISLRCDRIRTALQTEQRSLSLAALCWRVALEPMFELDFVNHYTEAEENDLRETLAAIEQKAAEWRQEIFTETLSYYLMSGRERVYSSPQRKSMSVPIYIQENDLGLDLAQERWGKGRHPDLPGDAEAYFNEHAYADQMQLSFRITGGNTAILHAGGVSTPISHNSSSSPGYVLNPFAVLETTEDVTLSFNIKGDLKVIQYTVASTANQGTFLDDLPGEDDLTLTVNVNLPGGRTYTYVELLNALYLQQKPLLLSIAYDWLVGDTPTLWGQSQRIITAVHHNGVLLWPAFRDIIIDPTVIAYSGGLPIRRSFSLDLVALQRGAVLKDIDFWMF